MAGLINVAKAHKNSGIPYNTIYVAAKDGRIEGASQIGDENSMWLFSAEAFDVWAKNEYRPRERRARNGNGRPKQ